MIMPLNMEICDVVAQLKRRMQVKNTKFSIADGVHLATAQIEQAFLVTLDSDFKVLDKVLLF